MTAKDGPAALANADSHSAYEVGMCLKFVRGPAWEIGSLYASAIDAWNGAVHRHPGDRNPPTGAPCFYRGGTYGHIVVARKHDSGRMRSTDCTYSGHVGDEDIGWPETAWGDDYLGWTEDLNGVRLPLGDEEDVLNSDDKDWIRGQIEASEKDVINRVNSLVGDVVPYPTKDDKNNTVAVKTALKMLLERTD